MRPAIAIAAALFAPALVGPAAGETSSSVKDGALQIALPHDGDEYSKLVARAAAHDTSVDFRALRFAWLKSAARRNDKADHSDLKDALLAAVKSGDDRRVRDVAVKMLSADYTDMFGHKFLRQACARLHDDACAEQGHFVEFGLLKSIVATGDGKTCDTGWEVVAVTEEYFMIDMMGDTPAEQSLIQGKHGACDLLHVRDENGKPQDYYFRIDAVLADEAGKLGR
jgi:hypothetical protein